MSLPDRSGFMHVNYVSLNCAKVALMSIISTERLLGQRLVVLV